MEENQPKKSFWTATFIPALLDVVGDIFEALIDALSDIDFD